MIALAVAAYALVKNDAYLKLDATLHVATSVTAMSAALRGIKISRFTAEPRTLFRLKRNFGISHSAFDGQII